MKTAILHLVHAPGQTEGFLRSYYEHPTGADHELFLVVKGDLFVSQPGFNIIRVSGQGRSLWSFGAALKHVSAEEFDAVCFLNSYSRIEAEDWLLRMTEVLVRPNVVAVGCTASSESFLSNRPSLWRTWFFPAWPNPHLRTNGIALRLGVAKVYWPWWAWNKPLEHLAESGWWGLTNRLRAAGYECALVDKTQTHILEADSALPKIHPMITDNRCRKDE